MKQFIVITCLFLVVLIFLLSQFFESRQETEPIQNALLDGWELDDSVKHLDEMIEGQRIIPLIPDESAQYGDIQDLVVFDHAAFFSDNQGKTIFKADFQSHELSVVSTQGQGPGEVGHVGSLTQIFDEQFACYDMVNQSIHVFNHDGIYQLSTPNFNHFTGRFVLHGPRIIWKDRNTLYVSSYQAWSPDDLTWHAKFDVVWNDKNQVVDLRLNRAFGQKPMDHFEKFGHSGVYVFKQIGQRIWVGSPNFSQVWIYDLNGVLLNEVWPDVNEPLLPELYQDLTVQDQQQLFKIRNWNGTIHDIEAFGALVAVKVGFRGYVLFEQNGKQVSTQRLPLGAGSFNSQQPDRLTYKANFKYIQSTFPNAQDLIPKGAILEPFDEEQAYLVMAEAKPQRTR